MAGLFDGDVPKRVVTIRGAELAITGVSADHVADLLARFDLLREVIVTRGEKVGFDDIRDVLPDVIAATIAAGCGRAGDADAIRDARSLGVGEQWEIIEAILDTTFPQGFDAFATSLTTFFQNVGTRIADDPARSLS